MTTFVTKLGLAPANKAAKAKATGGYWPPKESNSESANVAEPTTVGDVIRDRPTQPVTPAARRLVENVTGENKQPTQADIREAHRASRLDGEISDREPIEAIDVIRAGSAAARRRA